MIQHFWALVFFFSSYGCTFVPLFFTLDDNIDPLVLLSISLAYCFIINLRVTISEDDILKTTLAITTFCFLFGQKKHVVFTCLPRTASYFALYHIERINKQRTTYWIKKYRKGISHEQVGWSKITSEAPIIQYKTCFNMHIYPSKHAYYTPRTRKHNVIAWL